MSSPGLLDRTVGFLAELRRVGLPVSLAESLDAVRALGAIDLLRREDLRAALAATTVKRPAHRAAYDRLFDLWFPPALGEGASTAAAPQPPPEVTDEAATDTARDALRARLRDLLLDGDDEALRRLARQAVSALGRAETAPGRQSFFAYRVLRQLRPETLMADLLDALLHRGGDERGGLAEKVARQTIGERLRRFQELVEAEVRRRLAEEKGVEQVSRAVVAPLTEQVDFLRATREDMVELRRTVYPLARRLATRLTARRQLGDRGRLDFRRTVRASLATGGVPLVTHHRPHRPHKPELVVLCDVSGSVASFAHFTLLLAYALREQFTKVRAFAFIDTVDEVTRFFVAGSDVVEAMSRMAGEATLVEFDGHSDYGNSLQRFEERYPDAVGPRTSLLVLGDARNNYRATGAASLKRLCRQARHSYWLNPEPRAYWLSGDSAVASYAEIVDEMVECRNAEQLTAFVERLLPV